MTFEMKMQHVLIFNKSFFSEYAHVSNCKNAGPSFLLTLLYNGFLQNEKVRILIYWSISFQIRIAWKLCVRTGSEFGVKLTCLLREHVLLLDLIVPAYTNKNNIQILLCAYIATVASYCTPTTTPTEDS